MSDVNVDPIASITHEMIQVAASLTARHVPDEDICFATEMTKDQLKLLRNSDVYKKEAQQFTSERVSQQLSIDSKWDKVEDLSLDGVLVAIAEDRGDLEPHALLNMATMANKAKRRVGETGKQDRGDAGVIASQTVNIMLPSALVQQLNILQVQHVEGKLPMMKENEIGDSGSSTSSLSRFNDQQLAIDDVSAVLGVDVNKRDGGGLSGPMSEMNDEFLTFIAGSGVAADDDDNIAITGFAE